MTTNRTATEWRGLVAEWRASRMPRRVFAQVRGVNPQTLSWWAWRLRSRAVRSVPAAPSFAEVVVAEVEEAPSPEFVVEVGAVRVRVGRGFDADELRRLVGALC